MYALVTGASAGIGMEMAKYTEKNVSVFTGRHALWPETTESALWQTTPAWGSTDSFSKLIWKKNST